MDTKNNLTLILLLIYKFPKFANSYDLIRILERKFDFFDPRDLFTKLIEENYMFISNYEDKVSRYSISDLGINYVEENMQLFKKQILTEYTKERDFINLMLE